MAIIRPASIVGAISGSIDSVTFARGRQGPIARSRPLKTRGLTRKQSLCRATYAAAHAAWQDLDEAERQGWRNVAFNYHRPNRLGVQSQLSGWQLFVKFFIFASHYEFITPGAPPTLQTHPGPLTLVPDFNDTGHCHLTVTSPTIVGPPLWELHSSRTWSSKADGPAKQWTFVTTDIHFSVAVDISVDLLAATPPLIADEVIWYRVRTARANYLPSPWLVDSTTVT